MQMIRGRVGASSLGCWWMVQKKTVKHQGSGLPSLNSKCVWDLAVGNYIIWLLLHLSRIYTLLPRSFSVPALPLVVSTTDLLWPTDWGKSGREPLPSLNFKKPSCLRLLSCASVIAMRTCPGQPAGEWETHGARLSFLAPVKAAKICEHPAHSHTCEWAQPRSASWLPDPQLTSDVWAIDI